jgi:hypothetical protein
MAGKSALPLIALAGGVALLMSRKKKKKKAVEDYADFDLPIPDVPEPPPKKTSKRPAGNPPCVGPRAPEGAPGCYEQMYWGENTLARMTKIRQYLSDLGYAIEVGPWPVNKIGPKGNFEVTNKDGSIGRLGGNDDESSDLLRGFQNDYNAVSRCKELSGVTGGLAPDGLMGYFTLDGLRASKESLGAKTWQDVLKTCSGKGYTP